jgi:hypothetical protein
VLHDRAPLAHDRVPLAHERIPSHDVFKFRRFRLNVISFLRLPLGVSENELREVIKECSANLHACYLARAERSAMEWTERRATANGTADSENFDFHDTMTLIL